MDHIMVDLETMGTSNDAAIISIGAVKFNTTEITDAFHVGIDLQNCVDYGLKIDAGTIMWWINPDRDIPRKEWLTLDKVDLHSALQGFAAWMGEPAPVWGNGANFDNVILRNAYRATGHDAPWPFWMDRCYRTMKTEFFDVVITREGTQHNALDDATYQANHLIEIWRHIAKGVP